MLMPKRGERVSSPHLAHLPFPSADQLLPPFPARHASPSLSHPLPLTSVRRRTMSRLFPSEIARLVLGYLKEKGCQRSHDEFLRESPDLSDLRSCLSGPNTYDYPTSVNGKSLLQLLNGDSASQAAAPVAAPVLAAPVVAQAVPIIATSLPVLSTPVVSTATATASVAMTAREVELLRKLQANQATISSLNQKMNEMTSKNKVPSDPQPQQRVGKRLRTIAPAAAATAPIAAAAAASVTAATAPPVTAAPVVPVSQDQSDPFKTPVKQIRRSRASASTPVRRGSEVASPRKSTPRKSATPRKLTSGGSDATPSSQDATLTPSKAAGIHIEPEKVVEKFLSNPVMPELLALEINRIWNSCNESGVETLVGGDVSVLASGVKTPVKSTPAADSSAPVEKVVTSVVKELEQHSTINQFISDFAANECLMDSSVFSDLDCLFGSESSPFSSYDSTPVHSVGDDTNGDEEPGSLTTPKSAYREPAIAASSSLHSTAVKNLMQELRTPEKTRAPTPTFNSSPFVPSSRSNVLPASPVCIRIPDPQEERGSRRRLQAIAPAPRQQHVPVLAVTAASASASASVAGVRTGGAGSRGVEREALQQALKAAHQVPGKQVRGRVGQAAWRQRR